MNMQIIGTWFLYFFVACITILVFGGLVWCFLYFENWLMEDEGKPYIAITMFLVVVAAIMATILTMCGGIH